ncbi:hypothetical protein KZY45_004289, partial [Vibrio vulnificus]|nr:hypothetical protein [Vibrio vulnificus]
MECSSCGSTLGNPNIIDDVAYFVCSSCGNLREVEGYKEMSFSESIQLFESRFGFLLHSEFIGLLGEKGSWVVGLPQATTEMTKCYFGDGFY